MKMNGAKLYTDTATQKIVGKVAFELGRSIFVKKYGLIWSEDSGVSSKKVCGNHTGLMRKVSCKNDNHDRVSRS